MAGYPLRADVIRADDEFIRPAIVHMHGGALINGKRSEYPMPWLKFVKAGYVVVSIDYRLAPETQLPESWSDIEDAFAWVRARGPGLFGIDPARVAALGGSAGGYLALLSGCRLKHPPAAIVSLWGYGDISADWYAKPSPHALRLKVISREEAFEGLVRGQPVVAPEERKAGGFNGGRFYGWCRQNGTWAEFVIGIPPGSAREIYEPWCPLYHARRDFPPAILVHGENDEDVPASASTDFSRALEEMRAPYELVIVQGGGHGLEGAEDQHPFVHERVLKFLFDHLR